MGRERSPNTRSDRTTLQRRQFVGAGAAAALSGLAGCAFGFGEAPTTVDVFVRNDDEATRTVDVVVEFGDGTLLDEQFVVPAGGEQQAVFANPDETGDATVSASVRDGGSAERDVPAGRGSGLSSVSIEIGAGGSVETNATIR